MDSLIQNLAISAIPLIFALTLHEAAHGYAALRFGDTTAAQLGRLSLNPARHIDPVGTVLVPGIMMLIPGGIVFGWAKPTPIRVGNLRNPKRDMFWVAFAGPMANLLMALAWAALIKMALVLPPFEFSDALREMGLAGLRINAIFAVLNLLPLPSFDGGTMLTSLLPLRAALSFERLVPYGMLIFFVLLLTRIIDVLLFPPLAVLVGAIRVLFAF